MSQLKSDADSFQSWSDSEAARLNALDVPDSPEDLRASLAALAGESEALLARSKTLRDALLQQLSSWDSANGRAPVRETSINLCHDSVQDALERRKRALERKLRRVAIDGENVLKEKESEEKKRELKEGLRAAELFATAVTSSPSVVRKLEPDDERRKLALEEKAKILSSVSRISGVTDNEEVERLMEKRRQAQIEAEAVMKKEKERRAAEETQRAMEQEAATLGLPRLIMIRGEVRPRAVLVKCSVASLTLSHHFILETEDSLFHFRGPSADVSKLKFAVKAIAAMRKERLRKVKVVSMKRHDEPQPEFWAALGGQLSDVITDGKVQTEQEWEATYEQATRFYRSDKDVGLLPEPELQSTDLEASSAIVVVAPGEFYLWFGSNIGLNQRKVTEQKALEDIGWECERWVRLTIVQQGKEPFLFQEKFPTWELHIDVQNSTPVTARKKVSDAQIAKMLAFDPDLVPVVDDVYGTTEVWLASDFTKVPVARAHFGQFFNQSSYIVLYRGSRDTVLYFWQGSRSTTLWQHARDAILDIQQKASEKGEKVPIIRLIEGDEPPHFLGVFQGRMCVRTGAADNYESVATFLSMYHVRGFNMFNTRTVQCSPTAQLLDSDDAFIVYDNKTLFIFKVSLNHDGTHVGTFAFETAQTLAKSMYPSAKAIVVNETLEPPSFWKALGGKKEHSQHRVETAKPRLFIYSKGNISGKSAVLFSHLRPHDQVLLDVQDKVYVWSGKFSPSKDSFFALQVAQSYLKKGGRESVAVMEVRDGKEPTEFLRFFLGWQFPEEKLVEGLSKEAAERREVVQSYVKYYTLEQLQEKNSLPPTLNFNKLEQYLSDVEFVEVFGLPKEAWYKQPAWKRTEQKKEKGLF